MRNNMTLIISIVFIGVILGSFMWYHNHQNALNREAYYECLRVTKAIAESDERNGIRIVSAPHCRL
jgi:uncharacterized protein YxeA